jgi:CAAX protease family protein
MRLYDHDLLTVRAHIWIEGSGVCAILILGYSMAFVEGRRLRDYNLADKHGAARFFSGIVCGFAGVSILVGAITLGGWIHWGVTTLDGPGILRFGTLWAVGSLFTGMLEEGIIRCYLLSTLEREIDFTSAIGLIGAMVLSTSLNVKGAGACGLCVFALFGAIVCTWQHFSCSCGGNFWYAAWITSIFFGFIHTGNNSENSIGIFTAAAIGFVFCISVRLTGSAWWAIGCHTAWDWTESFFYGTANSGIQVQGHFLTSSPIGPAIWNGGKTGPEGSLLLLPLLVLSVSVLWLGYGHTWRSGGLNYMIFRRNQNSES